MDSRDLDGSCVIVTGGGSGIGRAIVDAVVAQGGRAAVWDVDEGALRDCAGRHGDAVTTARIDVSDEKAVRQAAERLTQDFAAPTHLVNNAGITGKLMPLVRMETDQIDRVLGVNLKGMLYCMSAFLAHRAPHPHAAIVNLASIAARTGGAPGNVLYAATKGAVISLTIAAAKELAPDIRVNALAPGVIDTPIQASSFGDVSRLHQIADTIPLRRLGAPADVAEAAVWLLSGASSYLTATVIDVAGGR